VPRLRDLDPEQISPYLRQHVDNPVEWYEWGTDAFELARTRDVPVLLSIGYSSCHWCHVMAHESFENAEIAAFMNEHFVSVKVDREERPDVDAIYMEAVQRITGRGGWPLTAFLTPDGEPFYAGTYFPPSDRQGMPGFPRVLAAMDDVWHNRRNDALEQASVLRAALADQPLDLPPQLLTADDLDAAANRLVAHADRNHGGFGPAPKFPSAMAIEFLWHTHVRTGAPELRDVASLSLDRMAAGGIHDHIGGGFHRYSVDSHWLVPHFEKMLYDQAMLLRAFTAGWLVTGYDRWRRVAEGVVEYVLRDLAHPTGGWFSAEDADSEGLEGRFYVWSKDELRAALASALTEEEISTVEEWFGVATEGNFKDPTGHAPTRTNILHRPPSQPFDLDEPPAVQTARELLFTAREVRPRPGLDDKVLLAWNALFLRALVEAAAAFDRPDWMDAARANARFLLTMRDREGNLLRSWQSGRARHSAYAEDHAALLGALISLAEHDELDWLDDARPVAQSLLDGFAAPDGGFFTTAHHAERLIVRTKDLLDNATPSANSLAADALLRLSAITGAETYAHPARQIIEMLGGAAPQHPTALANLLIAAERVAFASIECAVVIPNGSSPEAATALVRVFTHRLVPASVMVTAPDADRRTPLLNDRHAIDAVPTAYLCEANTCQLPTTHPETLREQLDAALARRSR